MDKHTNLWYLHLNDSGIMGMQTQQGNKWYEPFGIWGGQNENIVFVDVSNNPITVHEPNSGSLYHPSNNVLVGAQWFKYQFGSTWSASYPNPCFGYFVGVGDDNKNRLTYTDTLIVNDSINAVQFEEELKYFTSRDLLEKLTANDSLRNDNGIFENFYNEKSFEAAGPLSVSNYILQTDYSSEAVETSLGLLNDALDSLLVLDSLALVDTIYLAQHHAQGLVIHLIIDSLRNQTIPFLLQKDSLIVAAGILNSTVVPSNDIEYYIKALEVMGCVLSDDIISSIRNLYCFLQLKLNDREILFKLPVIILREQL